MPARAFVRRALAALRPMALERAVARIDPCPDPDAERITLAFVVTFLAFAGWAIWRLSHFAYEPGQDVPYHTFCTRVVAEWGRAGSPYTARYEPLHPTEANTLVYWIGGLFGRAFGAIRTFRALRAVYFVGLPVAVLYALRRTGRSPWAAIFAFPMAYVQAYPAGFVNFEFAAPAFVLAIVTYDELLARPTLGRGIAVAALFVFVFLSHAHVYLWLGCVLALVTVIGLGREVARDDGRTIAERARAAGARLGYAVLAGAPSLLLFRAWYARTYGAGKAVSRDALHAGWDNMFGAVWYPAKVKLGLGPEAGVSVTQDPHELWFFLAAGVIVLLALALGRLERQRRVPVLELCAIVTLGSYFVLPDSISGQQVALRAWDMAGWLAPFLVVPVAARASRPARWAVVAAIVVFSFLRLRQIDRELASFNDDEMAGFDAVVRAAPPGDHVVAFAVMNAYSKYFRWRPLHQWSAMLAAKRGYEAPLYATKRDSNMPLRYEDGPPAPPMLMEGEADWPRHPGLWAGYDLVLVRGWAPSAEELEHARARADLVAQAGAWQLWRRR